MIHWHDPAWDPSWLTPARLHARDGFVRSSAQIADRAAVAVGAWHWPRLSPAPATAVPAWVLIGGAGFLGARIAAMLLREDDPAPVVIVSRRPRAVADQLATWLDRAEVAALLASPRLYLVTADIARGDDGWMAAVPRAGHILHLAGAMHALTGWDRLAPLNLGGLRPAIALARRDGAALHLASTLSVFVSSNAPRADVATPLARRDDMWLHGGYAQTKAAAEYALAADGTVRGHVIRHGLLVPEGGGPFPPGHLAPAFADALRKVGALPDMAERAMVDLTPVAAAAATTIRLARAGASPVHHCANPTAASLEAIVTAGEALPVIDRAAWRARVAALPATPRTLLRAAFDKTYFLRTDAVRGPLLNMDLFQATHRRFVAESDGDMPGPAELLPGTVASMRRGTR